MTHTLTLAETMRARSILTVILAGALAYGCGKRVPEPVNVAPGTPYVTWVLMYGDGDNPDSEFACQSDPQTDCVLPVSRPDAQTFSDIHVYYHGAGAQTKYEGTVNIGYLRGSREAQTTRTSISVQKNESITNQSVTGIVTSTPGTYSVTWSLTATVVESKKTFPVRQSIQVVVK